MNKLGIELSYLLRHHKPYQAIISKEGYIATSQILLDMNIVKNVLDDIVKNDPENRFEYSTDKEYIRSRNGHSLDVNITYPKAEIPTDGLTVYHGTIERFYGDILRDGLKPQDRQYVHLTSNYDKAVRNAHRRKKAVPIVIEIKLLSQDLVFLASPDTYLVHYIEPTRLKEFHHV